MNNDENVRTVPASVTNKLIRLPVHASFEHKLYDYAKKLKIPYFRCVYIRNALPSTRPWRNESAIVNLDDESGSGTHWYATRNAAIVYTILTDTKIYVDPSSCCGIFPLPLTFDTTTNVSNPKIQSSANIYI